MNVKDQVKGLKEEIKDLKNLLKSLVRCEITERHFQNLESKIEQYEELINALA